MKIDLKYSKFLFNMENAEKNIFRYVISTKKLDFPISDYSLSFTLHKKEEASVEDCIKIVNIKTTNEETNYEIKEDESINIITWNLHNLNTSTLATIIVDVEFLGTSNFEFTENIHEEFILNETKEEYDFNASIYYYNMINKNKISVESDSANEEEYIPIKCSCNDKQIKEFNLCTKLTNKDGQIFRFNIRIKDVCPFREVLLGIIIDELTNEYKKKTAVFRIIKIPSHTVKPCKDIVLKDIEILLYDLDYNKKYTSRVIAQYK